MNVSTQNLAYGSTGYFSKIVVDYINGVAALQPFYKHPVSIEGIKAAIEERKKYPTDRKLLTDVLTQQYDGIALSGKQQFNLQQLSNNNTFTITTAHQPNIFTGQLYFIYKILHTVKIAEELATKITDSNFVPVYYMGSEDADLEELGHVYINGEKHEWETTQTGAVGRMKVDTALLRLMDAIEGELLVYPSGAAIISLMKACYKEGTTIEAATFALVNELFAAYGVLVLLPDNAALKNAFAPVIEKELLTQFSHKAVAETEAAFHKDYKLQASGRELNMFYLKDSIRERIEKNNDSWTVVNSNKKFNKEEIIQELKNNPERFSPNVILRPVFQETILPNIVFVGGGGEIAYWLELKKVFEAVHVPYPVMVVRNSFMVVPACFSSLSSRLGFEIKELFKPEMDLLNELVQKDSTVQLSLEKEKQATKDFYEQLKGTASAVDITLLRHTEALHAQALKKINALEKKMLKAEKKKFAAQERQLHKLKVKLFPNGSLQERVENFMPFYAKGGKDFLQMIYLTSKALEQQFTIIQYLPLPGEDPCGEKTIMAEMRN